MNLQKLKKRKSPERFLKTLARTKRNTNKYFEESLLVLSLFAVKCLARAQLQLIRTARILSGTCHRLDPVIESLEHQEWRHVSDRIIS